MLTASSALQELADCILLGDALQWLAQHEGFPQPRELWQQTCHHFDMLFELSSVRTLPGRFLVIAINCNGGIKEIYVFDRVPDRWALWHHRCPENPAFAGDLPPTLGYVRTWHWEDPAKTLAIDDEWCELKSGHRERQRGGGYVPVGIAVPTE